jgi:hypothetical protein
MGAFAKNLDLKDNLAHRVQLHNNISLQINSKKYENKSDADTSECRTLILAG